MSVAVIAWMSVKQHRISVLFSGRLNVYDRTVSKRLEGVAEKDRVDQRMRYVKQCYVDVAKSHRKYV
jgi:hypothetical protein